MPIETPTWEGTVEELPKWENTVESSAAGESQEDLDRWAREAWKQQPKTGFLGSFGKEFVGSLKSTARGPAPVFLSEDTLKDHLLGEYAKATTAPQQTGAGKIGGFLGGLAGTIGQAIPIGIATGPAGIMGMFGSQGEYNEFLRAGMRALSEGKTPEEAVKIGRKSGLIGGAVGSALGLIMPAKPATTLAEAVAQGTKMGGAAALGRVGENVGERALGLKTPVGEDVLEEGLTMAALPPAGHVLGRALRIVKPPPQPEIPAAPLPSNVQQLEAVRTEIGKASRAVDIAKGIGDIDEALKAQVRLDLLLEHERQLESMVPTVPAEPTVPPAPAGAAVVPPMGTADVTATAEPPLTAQEIYNLQRGQARGRIVPQPPEKGIQPPVRGPEEEPPAAGEPVPVEPKPPEGPAPAGAVADPAELVQAEQEIRKGISEKTWKEITDGWADDLENLKMDSGVSAFGVVPAVWNTNIKGAQLLLRAGGSLADAVEKVITGIKGSIKEGWDESAARQYLYSVLGRLLNGEPLTRFTSKDESEARRTAELRERYLQQVSTPEGRAAWNARARESYRRSTSTPEGKAAELERQRAKYRRNRENILNKAARKYAEKHPETSRQTARRGVADIEIRLSAAQADKESNLRWAEQFPQWHEYVQKQRSSPLLKLRVADELYDQGYVAIANNEAAVDRITDYVLEKSLPFAAKMLRQPREREWIPMVSNREINWYVNNFHRTAEGEALFKTSSIYEPAREMTDLDKETAIARMVSRYPTPDQVIQWNETKNAIYSRLDLKDREMLDGLIYDPSSRGALSASRKYWIEKYTNAAQTWQQRQWIANRYEKDLMRRLKEIDEVRELFGDYKITEPKGPKYATQEGQVKESVQPEREGTDAQRIPPEAGSSDSLQPEAPKPPRSTEEDFLLKQEPSTAEPAAKTGELPKAQPGERRKTLKEIREQNKLGGQAGFVNLSPIVDAVDRLRNEIDIWFKQGKVKEAMSFKKDRANNMADRYANEHGNELGNMLFRALKGTIKPSQQERLQSVFAPWKDPNELYKTALTVGVESFAEAPPNSGEVGVTGRSRLALQRAKLQAYTPPDATMARWKDKGLAAIDYAIANWNRLEPVVQRYMREMKAEADFEQAKGVDTLIRNGYVMHETDLEGRSRFDFLNPHGGGEGAQWLKNRVYPTYVDKIIGNSKPVSMDAIALAKARIRSGQRKVNNAEWTQNLRNEVDPTSGKPILTDAIEKTRADGKHYYDPVDPDYTLARIGYETYSIHKGYDGAFEALTDPSWFSRSLPGQTLMKLAGSTKHVVLAFDTFHLGRVGFWASIIQGKPAGYKKGLVLLNYTMPEIQEMARRGEIPREYLADITENKRKIDLAMKTGFNVARVQDALWQDWTQKIPGTGAFQKWLFGEFQQGAMMESWLAEFARQKKAFSWLSEDQVARNVSKELNTRFGNLQSQGWFRSKTAQDLARLMFLAPQWNEGLIMSELKGLAGVGKTLYDAQTRQKLAVSGLTRAAGIMMLSQFAANQLINLVSRGHPTWENKEDGLDAKLSAYIPDYIGEGPGLFWSPMALPAETAHLLYKMHERTGDMNDAINSYARSRLSTVARPIATLAFKKDAFGRNIRSEELWKEFLKSAIPAPISGSAGYYAGRQVATGEKSEQFPGQFQKQALASLGVKTETAPTATQQIARLARTWNENRGKVPPGEFYSSPYTDLDRLLRAGNTRDALRQLDDLVKKKNLDQIFKRYEFMAEMNFTHSSEDEEADFFNSLTKDQKDAYLKARMERAALADRFYKLWAIRQATQPATR